MKIAILELHNYHYDVINSLCEVYEENIEILYINKQLKEVITNKEKIKKIELLEEISIRNTLKIINSINRSNVDYVILGTNQGFLIYYFIFFLFCRKKIIMSMHNINVYFEYNNSLKGIVKFLIRKFMVMKCYGINVLGETLKRELENRKINKKIINFPVRIYRGVDRKKIDNEERKEVIISIPGSFELKRREYETVYKACLLLLNKIDKKVKLNFLGKIDKKNKKEQALLEKFKKITKVYYSENFIEETEFRKKVLESDLLLNPSIYETTYDGVKEYYGKTKQSGGMYTQIEFAKPGLAPSYIKVEPELKSSTVTYKNEKELAEIIIKFDGNKKYRELLINEAEKNSKKYTLESIRKKLLKELEE